MDLPIALDSHLPQPLHAQLYAELQQAILTGRLLPSQRIPSTRSLAQSLSISRTTVTQSYEQLLSEGYLEAIVGSGTYVCAQLPDDLLYSQQVEPSTQQTALPIQFSQQGKRLAEIPCLLPSEPKAAISFRYGRPALKDFPLNLWRKLLSRHCTATSDWLDYASDFRGYYPLREAIARYVARARAVQCAPDQIILTNGTQQALDLVMRLLIDPGEVIAVEDPGYLSARRVFLSYGASLHPVPVDESGLQVDQLTREGTEKAQIQKIRLVYVTPSHQFPTGSTLSLPRRLELLAWAQQNHALILEDDYDSEYRYGDRPILALQGLDRSHSVIYISSFSKVLFPSLRLGYLIVPSNLVMLFTQMKWLSDRQLPTLEQQVLAEFIADGHLESHVRKMRSRYDHRRQVLVQGLKQHFGDRIVVLGEKAGLHIMVRMNLNLGAEEIVERAAQVGVGLMSARPCYLHSSAHDPNFIDRQCEFIFGYSELDEAEIQVGISRLAKALNP
ncbi:MAG TPA: PLP-dependent aminotransferase family protein [Coleofasciculaceae cyanobacterium]|jgi:GntR family transcriptional regulator/MocR family aminotransferase